MRDYCIKLIISTEQKNVSNVLELGDEQLEVQRENYEGHLESEINNTTTQITFRAKLRTWRDMLDHVWHAYFNKSKGSQRIKAIN